MKLQTRILLVLCCLALVASASLAERPLPQKESNVIVTPVEVRDAVYLKNGNIIRGSIIELVPDSLLRIQTRDGSVFVYAMSEVLKIVKEDVPVSAADSARLVAPVRRQARTVISPLIGYGTEEWFNFGIGGKIGATFSSGMYLGCTFVYHFGKSQDYSYSSGFSSYSYKISLNTMLLGLEVGHDAQASERLTIRPAVTLGYISFMAAAEYGSHSSSNSEGKPFIAPGLTFNILPSQKAIIGLEGKYIFVVGDDASELGAMGIYLNLGLIL